MAPPKKRQRTSKAIVSTNADVEPMTDAPSAAEIVQKRKDLLAPLKLVEERGMKFEICANTKMFRDLIKHMGWESFVQEPQRPCAAIVRDFYLHLPESSDDSCMVKRHSVSFSIDTINELFETPPYSKEDDDYFHICTKPRLPLIMFRDLCTHGGDYIYVRGGPAVKTKCVSREAKIWNMFISSRFSPSLNASAISRNTMRLLVCILLRRRIDVGRIIHGEIMDIRKKLVSGTLAKNATLPFPILITTLCIRGGVIIPSTASFEPITPTMNTATLTRLSFAVGCSSTVSTWDYFQQHFATMCREDWTGPPMPEETEDVELEKEQTVRARRATHRVIVDQIYSDSRRRASEARRDQLIRSEVRAAEPRLAQYQFDLIQGMLTHLDRGTGTIPRPYQIPSSALEGAASDLPQ